MRLRRASAHAMALGRFCLLKSFGLLQALVHSNKYGRAAHSATHDFAKQALRVLVHHAQRKLPTQDERPSAQIYTTMTSQHSPIGRTQGDRFVWSELSKLISITGGEWQPVSKSEPYILFGNWECHQLASTLNDRASTPSYSSEPQERPGEKDLPCTLLTEKIVSAASSATTTLRAMVITLVTLVLCCGCLAVVA